MKKYNKLFLRKKLNDENKMTLFNSVSFRFVFFVMLLTILTGGIISFTTINISRNSIRQEVLDHNHTQATLVAEFTSDLMEVIQANIRSFSTRPLIAVYIEENDMELASKMLRELVKMQIVLDTCGLYDINGIQVASSDINATTIGQSFADREWFQQTIATKQPFQSVPIKSRVNSNAVTPYATPILNEQGQPIGVFAGAISLAKLSEIIVNTNNNLDVSYSIIDIRNGGVILANEDSQLILTTLSENNSIVALLLKDESGAIESTDEKAVKELIGFAPMSNLPWGAIISTQSKAAFSVIDDLTKTASIISIILVLIAIIVSGLFILRIMAPIRHLIDGTKEVGKGNLEYKFKITGIGEIEQLSRSFSDMTESLKVVMISNEELEQIVKERTSQLEAANIELESFSYSVSHDLRAPLRHVHGFVEMLRNHLQGNMDEKSQHYLDVISNATKDMGQLIDDLLSFSRIGKSQIKNVKVNLNLIVRDLITSYQSEMKNGNVKWNIAELPDISGDNSMIRQVFGNLISNALKFTSLKELRMIEIGFEPDAEKKDYVIIHIKDNGAGFDMQYIEKLFGVFQRLHSQNDFEGTGIGLANVKRIVQKHGGRVWAEGEIDEGAAFYFTLPKYKEE